MTLEQRGGFVLACTGRIAAVAFGLWIISPPRSIAGPDPDGQATQHRVPEEVARRSYWRVVFVPQEDVCCYAAGCSSGGGGVSRG